METMAEYLAELVKAGLEDRKAASLPEGVSVREIVKISEENHMDYLLSLIHISEPTRRS